MKPGGQWAILDFFKPTGTHAEHLGHSYIHRLLPRIGAWLSKDESAYSYLARSMKEFVTIDQFKSMAENHGFQVVKARRLFPGVIHLVVLQKNLVNFK